MITFDSVDRDTLHKETSVGIPPLISPIYIFTKSFRFHKFPSNDVHHTLTMYCKSTVFVPYTENVLYIYSNLL